MIVKVEALGLEWEIEAEYVKYHEATRFDPSEGGYYNWSTICHDGVRFDKMLKEAVVDAIIEALDEMGAPEVRTMEDE